jgi:hypothetical protein
MLAGEVKNIDSLSGVGEVLVIDCPLVCVNFAVVKYKKFWRGFR